MTISAQNKYWSLESEWPTPSRGKERISFLCSYNIDIVEGAFPQKVRPWKETMPKRVARGIRASGIALYGGIDASLQSNSEAQERVMVAMMRLYMAF